MNVIVKMLLCCLAVCARSWVCTI